MARRRTTEAATTWRARNLGFADRQPRYVREAYRLIFERAEDCGARILYDAGPRGLDRFVEPVLALAQAWKYWQRPVYTWAPESRDPKVQFRELARHLLARYPVPHFMDSLFLDESLPELRPWFHHVGTGGNIRTAPGMTAKLTSRMAHLMMQAPSGYGVIQAVRLGQVLGLGGKAALARVVCNTFLGRTLEPEHREEFWLTVLQWLVNHPEWARSQVGTLVDFLRVRHQVDAEFSMKGRSAAALRRLVDEWHRDLNRAPGYGYRQLPASGIASPRWETHDQRGRLWRMEELTDTYALHAEGAAMSHCVYSYAGFIFQGRSSIWSLKVREEDELERAITVEVLNASGQVVQARGRHNRAPTAVEREMLLRWAREHGIRVSA